MITAVRLIQLQRSAMPYRLTMPPGIHYDSNSIWSQDTETLSLQLVFVKGITRGFAHKWGGAFIINFVFCIKQLLSKLSIYWWIERQLRICEIAAMTGHYPASYFTIHATECRTNGHFRNWLRLIITIHFNTFRYTWFHHNQTLEIITCWSFPI